MLIMAWKSGLGLEGGFQAKEHHLPDELALYYPCGSII
jgi:hypothetical protein